MTGNVPHISVNQQADYEALLGQDAWRRLHPDVRRRFSRDYAHRAIVYQGVMGEVSMSVAGKLLAQICRFIGSPLALHTGLDVPTTVKVYPDDKVGGMVWDRFYHFPGKAVNRVKSTKSIRADMGLIELVGFGFGMYLRATEHGGAIHFESTRFMWQLGRFKILIPHVLSPGNTKVVQTALEDGHFRFDLDVVHCLAGRMFRQSGVFAEVSSAPARSPVK